MYPSDGDVFDRNRMRGGIRISTEAWSGAALVNCSWALYNQHGEAPALTGEAKIEGTTCSFDEMINPEPLRSGDYRLVIDRNLVK